MKRYRLLVLVIAISSACSRTSSTTTPTAPTPPPTARAINGEWSGSYVAVCPGNPACSSVGGSGPRGAQSLNLTLKQQTDAIDGQITLGGWLPRAASVAGTLASSGVMTLQGGDSWPRSGFCAPAGGWNLVSWNARYDAQSDLITGDFTFTTQKYLSSCYYDQALTVNATNVVLRRGATADTSFAGHWQGRYVVVKCVAVGWNSCNQPDYEPPFDLQLSQNGTAVVGEMTRIPYGNSTPLPVTGSAAAPTLAIAGARPQNIGIGTETFRITRWNVTRDDAGRLIGGFSYIDEVQWTGGQNAGQTWSMSFDAELKYVVRVPW